MIRCDGCGRECEVKQVLIVRDYGHQTRYCPECVEEYRSFVVACQAHERVMQTQLDTWILDARAQLRLLLCPMDLRSTTEPPTEQGMTLA